MPSTQEAAPTPSLPHCDTTPAEAIASPAQQLAQASRALWVATLSLMTAFMQNQAPAHRYLLARRIARNFDTLARQDCFNAGCRASFERLARRWQANSERLSPEPAPARSGFLASFF